MKKYFRIMLGKSSSKFEECYQKSIIGIDFDFNLDLSSENDPQFSDQINGWRYFNRKYIPIYQKLTGNTSNKSSGFACAKVWEVRFFINKGDIILSPDGKGNYFIGEVNSDYLYKENSVFTHCRSVIWKGKISKTIISNSMKNTMESPPTILNITKYKDEVENLLESIVSSENQINNFDYSMTEETSSEKVLLYQITDKSLGLKKLNVYNDFNDMQLVYELADCEEFTYIMFDRAHDTIKIGKTKNDPELRLAQLRTANPSITLLHTFPSTLYSEKDLHNKFYDHLKDLEWYYYARGVRKFISEESEKHKKIIEAYRKRSELDDIESDIFESIKPELEDI